MKKIVCEVCGSQNIKKENGVFVCKDCGIEYSSEEVKKLLVEVDENAVIKSHEIKSEVVKDEEFENFLMLNQLKCFIEYIDKIEASPIKASDIFDVGDENSNDNLLDYSENELLELKPYVTTPIDEIYLDMFGIKNIYKSSRLDSALKDYESHFQEERKKYLEDTNKIFEIEKEDNLQYSFELDINTAKKVNKLFSPKFSPDMFNETLFKIMNSFFVADVTYHASDLFGICDFLAKKRIVVDMEIQKYETKKGLFGKKENLVSNKKISNIFTKISSLVPREFKYSNSGLVDYINPVIEEYAEGIEPARKKIIDLVNSYKDLKDYISPIYKQVPKKYRNKKDLITIFDILLEKRAKSIGEALNLLDTYKYREQVLVNFEVLNNKLNILGASIYQIHKELKEQNQELASSIQNVAKATNEVKKLSKTNLVMSIIGLVI